MNDKSLPFDIEAVAKALHEVPYYENGGSASWEYITNSGRDYARRLAKALPQILAAHGCAVVPVVPTADMVRHGSEAQAKFGAGITYVYRAMINARPTVTVPETPKPEEVPAPKPGERLGLPPGYVRGAVNAFRAAINARADRDCTDSASSDDESRRRWAIEQAIAFGATQGHHARHDVGSIVALAEKFFRYAKEGLQS